MFRSCNRGYTRVADQCDKACKGCGMAGFKLVLGRGEPRRWSEKFGDFGSEVREFEGVAF